MTASGQSRRFCEIRIASANPLIAAVRRCAAIRWVQLTLGVIEPADNLVERFMKEDGEIVEVQRPIAPVGQINSLLRFQADPDCPVPARKIFHFRFYGNYDFMCAFRSERGTYASSRTWSGMRWTG